MSVSISVKRLHVVIDGVPILKDISVDIEGGKIVGLLGPSGAGKTTFMRVIVGRQRIRAGQVSVLGMLAGSPGLRGKIGYMTQAAAVYHDLTVKENLRYFGAMLGCSKKQIEAVISRVDLTPQANRLVQTLSGGQKSRVSLGIALLGDPDMLVLDEPTVGVDPVLRQQLWELFRTIAHEGTSILVSSHVMDEAGRCDDLLLIRDGRLLAHGTPHELCKHTGAATVEESFLKLVEETV